MSKSTELTMPQRAAVALGSAEHEAKLKDLAAKHADIVEIKNAAGREQCHGAMMTLANARVSIGKAGKAARDDANAFSKAVIAEEKRLIEIIEPEESRLRGMRDEWDAEREREKEAKAAAERQRIAVQQARIARIRDAVTFSADRSPAQVQEVIEDIEGTAVDATFEEFQGQAQLAKDETLDKLREIHAAAVSREEEAARLKAEREELERLRKEAAEREAAAAAQRAEEVRRMAEERAAQEAELRAQREAQERQLAAERAEADRIAREKLAAEEAELRKEREEQERKLAAERERQAAEAKRLADERAELEHQQREAAEQRRREEYARLEAEARELERRQAAFRTLQKAAPLLLEACQAALAECPDLNCAAQLRTAIDAATAVEPEFAEAA